MRVESGFGGGGLSAEAGVRGVLADSGVGGLPAESGFCGSSLFDAAFFLASFLASRSAFCFSARSFFFLFSLQQCIK